MDGPLPLPNGAVGVYPASSSGRGMPSSVPYGFGHPYPPMQMMYASGHGSPASIGFGAGLRSASGGDGNRTNKHLPSRSASTTEASAPNSTAGLPRSSSPGSGATAESSARRVEDAALRGDADGNKPSDEPTACAFFLKTGTCAYGDKCKFSHPLDKVPIIHFNTLGLPLRPGEPECAFYMKTLRCGFGASCKFHHPEAYWNMMPMMAAPGQVGHYLSPPPMWSGGMMPTQPPPFGSGSSMPMSPPHGMMMQASTVPSSPDQHSMLPRQPFAFMPQDMPGMPRAGSLPPSPGMALVHMPHLPPPFSGGGRVPSGGPPSHHRTGGGGLKRGGSGSGHHAHHQHGGVHSGGGGYTSSAHHTAAAITTYEQQLANATDELRATSLEEQNSSSAPVSSSHKHHQQEEQPPHPGASTADTTSGKNPLTTIKDDDGDGGDGASKQ